MILYLSFIFFKKMLKFDKYNLQTSQTTELIKIVQSIENPNECIRKIVVFGIKEEEQSIYLETLQKDFIEAKIVPYSSFLNISKDKYESFQSNKLTITLQDKKNMIKSNYIKVFCGNEHLVYDPVFMSGPLCGPIFIVTNFVDEWNTLLSDDPSLCKRVLFISLD